MYTLMDTFILTFPFYSPQGSEYEQHQRDPAQSLPPNAPVIRTVSTKSLNSHLINKTPSSQLTHDKKQSFPEPLIRTDLSDGD